ncbi:MAG: transcriptional regulator [Bryobacter sp.]|nr:transcriptional regulator [Bryobacter sp.]
MPLTNTIRDTVCARAQSDQAFVKALLTEAMNAYLSGDEATGKTILRDVVHSTIGFPHLGEALGKSIKSLHRMLGPSGNPNTTNFFAIFQVLQQVVGVRLVVEAA